MKTDRESGALRIMEALSAVDGELLERSGRNIADSGAVRGMASKGGAADRRHSGLYRFTRRYAGLCAACLLLAIAGTAYYGVSRIHMGSAESGMSGAGARDITVDMEAAPGEEMAAPEQPLSIAEAEGAEKGTALNGEGMAEMSTDGFSAGWAEPIWLEPDGLKPLAGEPEAAIEFQRKGSAVQQSAVLRREDFEARAEVPAGYSAVRPQEEDLTAQKMQDSGQEDSLLLQWSGGEGGLWLRLTRTELTPDLRFDSQPPVYTVQEEWRELIPDAGPDGYARFALLYEDGLLAEYCGPLEREEAIALMESLASDR